jgi:alkylation response protein AidB-like acyl-CoA dehydrogenase
MSFTLSDEQQELRKVVRDFLADHSSEADVRRLMSSDAGYDPQVWQRLAGELGLVGLVIPEEFGGGGFGWVELGVVLEETGRALLCAPFLSTVGLAVPVLIGGDPEVAKEYLPAIAAGETIATLALTEEAGSWDPDGVTTRAERDGGGWRVSGHKTFVPDGALADLLPTVARTPDGIGVFAVDATADGVGRRRLPTMDQTRRQAAIDLDDVSARPVLLEGQAAPVLRQALQRAAIAVAAEQVGGAEKALELAVEYAKTRTQFGRPIGSFQAIKHMCADMLLRVESGRSAVYTALQAADEASPELPAMASLAKAYCTDAFLDVTRGCIQVHGGIGVTWEHPAHLYFKRATSSAHLLGHATRHRELFAAGVLG